MTAKTDFSPIRLSTDGVQHHRRDDEIREFYGRIVQRMEITPKSEQPMRIEATALALPGLTVAAGNTSCMTGERTRSLLSDNVDDIFLSVSSSGYSVSVDGRSTVEIAPGDAVLTSLDRRVRFFMPAESNALTTLQIPRASLGPLTSLLDTIPARALSARTPELQMLQAYLRMLNPALLATLPLRQAAANHLLDLVALAIGATREAAEIAQGRGVRAARFAAIKADIAAHLDNPNLSADQVAARLHLSARYVRKLFAEEGITLSEYVHAQRLALVHRRLSDPLYGGRKIADLAWDAGFSEIATFNRLFRKRYGLAPSDVREASQAPDTRRG